VTSDANVVNRGTETRPNSSPPAPDPCPAPLCRPHVLQTMSLTAPLERAATVLYWDRFAEIFSAGVARLRSEIGPVAADSYDEVRAKELETKVRRQLARARAAERG